MLPEYILTMQYLTMRIPLTMRILVSDNALTMQILLYDHGNRVPWQ